MLPDDLLTTARERGAACVPGVTVGHFTDAAAHTGCTVVVLPPGSVGGVDVRGGGCATRELALLDPTAMQPFVDAFVLTGGSALGLACADGVLAALREHGRGFPTDHGPVPLVPAAALFDLGVGGSTRAPGAGDGRAAYAARTSDVVERGAVGAGTGAMIGKVRGRAHAMAGGLGQAGLVLDDGLAVGAVVALNPFGDVIDPRTGRIVAGARADDGSFVDSARHLAAGGPATEFVSNTVLTAVVTNARLDKPSATRVARMAGAGVARTVSPYATSLDGDVVFAAGTGEVEASADRVGAIAAMIVAAAVLDGASESGR